MPYKDKDKQREAQRKWEKENRGCGVRHRVWMFVFYPDSADPDWVDIADELGLPFCVSPLHDRDTWTSHDQRKNAKHVAGTVKKAHFHGLAEYPQPVDYETVRNDFSFLHTTNVKYVKSKASMALYLCHIGTKGKAQYDPSDVQEFGGANWHDWCSELEDVHAIMLQMRAWLRDNVAIHHWEFSDFMDWCDAENDEWSRALDLSCAWAIGNYMDKQRAKTIYLAKVERAMVSEEEGETDAEQEQ